LSEQEMRIQLVAIIWLLFSRLKFSSVHCCKSKSMDWSDNAKKVSWNFFM